jgi:hypothetical protein
MPKSYRNRAVDPLNASANVARTEVPGIIRRVNSNHPRWLANWLERHQNRASRVLHAAGIPLAAAALVLAAIQLCLWRWDLWWRPVVLLVAGYVLQYIGHRLEGNDMGEVVLAKKLLGRPYVAVSPRYRPGTGVRDPQEQR